ncbi:hypothetical protein Tco_1350039, partial [Tanacetum coccineum]
MILGVCVVTYLGGMELACEKEHHVFRKFEYTISEAVGNSGGILCVWDPSVFCKEHHVVSDNFVALYRSWVSNQAKLLVVSIYAPQSIISKRSLWSYISSLISRWDVIVWLWVILMKLDAWRIVWVQCTMRKSAKKMSKLDRFFVLDICLDRHLSDHRPILLREVVTDYGPSP